MKLLNKSISLYIVYATVLLLIVIPVLYFAIQSRVVEEVDESLLEQKNKVINKLKKTDGANLLPWLQNKETDVTLTASVKEKNNAERFFTITNFDTISKEKSPYRILQTTILLHGKFYTVQIKSSLLDSEDLIESIVKIVALLLLLIITGLVLINHVLSKKLWEPFYSTINKLNDFKIENNGTLQFEKTGITEFTDLNNAITKLTNRNKEAYQSQKEFTENASHEMQTPLAVLQVKLDLLMQTDPLSKEQSELISDLADVNQRMNRLNKTLLLLTKIENNQFAENEKVSVKTVLDKLLEQYNFQALQKGIIIRNEVAADIEITANKILIEIMLGNLLSNAIKHNMEDGLIIIDANGRELSFINSAGTNQLNREKMFQRFYKQTADSNSLGLGLQIAKKIADNYHYIIRYTFQAQQHFFTIIFK